jgi:hypothetical protein
LGNKTTKPEKPTTYELDIGASIAKIDAKTDVMLSVVCEVLARISNQPVAVVTSQIESLVNERLSRWNNSYHRFFRFLHSKKFKGI